MFRRLLLLSGIALPLCAPVDLSAGVSGPSVNVSHERVLDGGTIFRLGKNENLCAITFDDGPGVHTAELLDILNRYQVRATFFVVGTQVERRPDLVRRMQIEGHEIANHTYAHATLRHQTPEQQTEAIGKVQQLLEALGVKSLFIRPPFGRYDLVTKDIARALGVRIVLWSVDSHDWRRKAGLAGLQSVAGGSADRGVFLFHDTHAPTISAMPAILDELALRQCRFVTISEYARVIEGNGANGSNGSNSSAPDPELPETADSSLSAAPSLSPAPALTTSPLSSSPLSTRPALSPAPTLHSLPLSPSASPSPAPSSSSTLSPSPDPSHLPDPSPSPALSPSAAPSATQNLSEQNLRKENMRDDDDTPYLRTLNESFQSFGSALRRVFLR